VSVGDEYNTIIEHWREDTARGKPKNLGKILLQSHSIHHNSTLFGTGLESNRGPMVRSWEISARAMAGREEERRCKI
jgi:hypothetical protein